MGLFTKKSDTLLDFCQRADPTAPLETRIAWAEKFIGLVRRPMRYPKDFDPSTLPVHTARIKALLLLLNSNLKIKGLVSATLRSLLRDTKSLDLFCSAGLQTERGFFSEASTRVLDKILPLPPKYESGLELFVRLFSKESDAVWVAALSPDIFDDILELFEFQSEAPNEIFQRYRHGMAEACGILGANVASIGLSPQLRARLRKISVADSPFYRLNFHLNRLMDPNDRLLVRNDPTELQNCLRELNDCHVAIAEVFGHVEEFGVSVALVYSLEVMQRSLRRIEILVKILSGQAEGGARGLVPGAVAELIRGSFANRTLGDLVRENLHLLSRKVVERAGNTGEHYIVHSRAEYGKMLGAGIGGGCVTVGTTYLKFLIKNWHLPIFFDGFFAGLNYATSFVSLQFAHFTLATKQPSVTASTLAGKLKGLEEGQGAEGFVEEVKWISRSQFAALVGNLGAAAPVGVGVALLAYIVTGGKPIISVESARHALDSLHPLHSGTVPMAILTGVLLWFSSLCAGWLENWAVYRSIPEAIAKNRKLAAVIGANRCEKISRWFSREIAGIGGNVSLGFLLGFTPDLGIPFGIPIDVRHVTLSTVAVAFAATVLHGPLFPWEAFGWACVGVLIVGFLNFGVSTILALAVAMRAREVRKGTMALLLKVVLKAFLRRPFSFAFPPRS